MFYGCNKNFDNGKYEEELKFAFIFSQQFPIVAPCIKNDSRPICTFKQKVVRNNNQPFMTKTLRKAIMKRSKLKNKFNKERNAKNWFNYKQQRNYCSNLLTESKTRHFDNLNVKGVTENNRFWKTIKSFYIYEPKNSNNILNENYQTIR